MPDALLVFAGVVLGIGIVLLITALLPDPAPDEAETWERARRATGGEPGE